MGRKVNDLSKQRFGKLLVIDRAGSTKHGDALWNCICDCGKKIAAAAYQLIDKRNPRIHCGCLTFQHRSDAMKGKKGKVNDLSKQRFGKLLVIDRAGSTKHRNLLWNCICDCGKKTVVSENTLTAKIRPKTHCGCLTSKHLSDGMKGKKNGLTHGLSRTSEYRAESQHKRRIRKQNNNAGVDSSYVEIAKPKLDYCVYCGVTDNLTTDHIIPIDKGGNQDPKNLIRACLSCNSAKRNLFFIDWYIKTNRCKRSLDDIIKDMGFDSIVHLQNYQDYMCPEHIDKDPNVRFHKLVKAESKDINKLLDLL